MDVSTFTARRRSLPAEGGEIAYTEFGDPSAPAALFVHGLATGGLMWRHVIEQLSGTTRCIAIDLPAARYSQVGKSDVFHGLSITNSVGHVNTNS